jgi:hypothetical protein
MYIAYYQRPADPAGLNYWVAQLSANGGGEAGWKAIAAAFANAPESVSLYGSATLETKIAAFYLASFERAASSTEISGWVTDAAAQGFTEAEVAFAIVNGGQNDDGLTVAAKASYSAAWVKAIDPTGLGDSATFTKQYNDPSVGRTALDAITKDSDVSEATVATAVEATLPGLVTVNLTSSADTVTPTANSVEQITAAIGGSNPTLGRDDKIDGGSASDSINISMDGNFLLGFSTGYMYDVEQVTLGATTSSVTPKQFNFTGTSGIETINVNGANAVINLNNIQDTGVTVNLTGQKAGSFDIGYASGLISGTGSAMTLGLAGVGSTGNNVSVAMDGITDLNVASSGTGSFVDLSNSVNDLKTMTLTGSSDLYFENIPTTLSGVEATGYKGNMTLTVDTDTNSVLLGASQTVTGGAGHDAFRLLGSGIAAATTSSIEELIFDGSNSEVIVRATGMANLSTLTYSGTTTNSATAPSISGLGSQDLTVNAILDGSTTQHNISGSGNLTVNLNSDSTNVSTMIKDDNDFTFKAASSGNLTINVGAYASVAGTLQADNAQGVLDISVDSTSVLGGAIKASGVSTASISGGVIQTTLSAEGATTISINASSGSLTVGSSAATTFSVVASGGLTLTPKLSGITTLTIDTGNGAVAATGLNTNGITTATVTGSGSGASVSLGTQSGSGMSTVYQFSGLAGGVSAVGMNAQSGSITISAEALTGNIDIDAISGASTTIAGGTGGNQTFDSILVTNALSLDNTAFTSGSGTTTLTLVSAGAASTVSMGSNASGGLTITEGTYGSNLTIDTSNFGGSLDIQRLSVSGTTAISLGSKGDLSAASINSVGNLTVDGSNASTGSITLTDVSAAGNATFSMGSGSGTMVMTSGTIGGNYTLDGSKFSGALDVQGLSVSGTTVVSVGSTGDFSAGEVHSIGNFTLDASLASSGQITLSNVSSNGAVTLSMGSGTGALSLAQGGTTDGVRASATLTLDASKFNGTIDARSLSASGAITISVGEKGDFSAATVATQGNFTLDASVATSGSISINNISSIGAATVSMGSGSGALTITNFESDKTITIDGSKFNGTTDIVKLSASGAVTVSLTGVGDFSSFEVQTLGTTTLDASTASSGAVVLREISSVGAVTISMGSGSGSLSVVGGSFLSSVTTDSSFTLDTTKFGGTVDLAVISASGAVTVSLGGNGDFSAGAIESKGAITIDANVASSGAITLTDVSGGGAISIDMGTGSGSVTLNNGQANSSFTLDGNGYKGNISVNALSVSGAATIVMGSGNTTLSAIIGEGSLTVSDIGTSGTLTMTGGFSVSGAVSISLGAGSGAATFSSITTNKSFTLDASLSTEDTTAIAANVISASGATISLGLQQNLTFSALEANGGAISLTTGTGSSDITGAVNASTSTTMTVNAAGSGAVTISAIGSLGAFTLNATGITTKTINVENLFNGASGGITLNYGSGLANFDASAVIGNSTFTLNGNSTVSAEIHIQSMSVSGAINVNLGGASGSFSAHSIDTDSSFTISGANASAFIDIANLSASGAISISLGATTVAADAFTLSSAQTDSAFTLNAVNYREIINIDQMSVSGTVTITAGDLTDALLISSLTTDSTIILNGGDGANFSATITDLNIGASGWTITMPELGNGLTILESKFSGTGTIVATNSADAISASSMSGAGYTQTVDIDLREDSAVDKVAYIAGAGKDILILRNFDSGEDILTLQSAAGANTLHAPGGTSMGIATAATIIGDALGLTLSSSNLASATVTTANDGQGSAIYTYNGDTYYLGFSNADATFDDGEMIVRFVGVTDAGSVNADILQL